MLRELQKIKQSMSLERNSLSHFLPGALLRPCSERGAATAEQELHRSRVHPSQCQDTPTWALTELQRGDAARLTPQKRQ